MCEPRLDYEDISSAVEARALMAVGMDGSLVILQVDHDNHYLLNDARRCASDLKALIQFSPCGEPVGPGLYEFRGYSALEPVDHMGMRVVHRGWCVKVAC